MVVLIFNPVDRDSRLLSAALGSARRAVELDPLDAMGQTALAYALNGMGDARNGRVYSRRAVELNPSLPDAWFAQGVTALLTDEPESAAAESEQSIRLSPRGPLVAPAYDTIAMANFELGRYEAGLDAGKRVVAAMPHFWGGYIDVGINAAALGRLDEAHAAIATGRRVEPNLSLAFVQAGYFVSRPAADARRNAALRQADLQ